MSFFGRSDKDKDSKDASTTTTPKTTAATVPTPARVEVKPVVTEVKPQPPAQAIAQPIGVPKVSTSTTPTRGVSVISKALKITGQLESTEDIQVDGEIDGDVRGLSVKVGNNAKVKGTVYGEEVELAGTVDGKIEAKKVVLTSTAKMSGDIVHQSIQIDAGAHVAGHLKPEYGKTETRAAAATTSTSKVTSIKPANGAAAPEATASAL